MATINRVFVPTRYASIENAKKSDKANRYKYYSYNGKVVFEVWSDEMRGKIKEYIETHATDSNHYGTGYNGYGWSHHHNDYYMSAKDGKELLALVESKKAKEKPAKTWEQIRDEWSRRLVRLLDGVEGYEWVTIDVAREIAQEKKDYKQDRINEVASRQHARYSIKREKLINKMDRENPLRRITDTEHAIAIIAASERHNNSNYESLLEQYREDAQLGIIDHNEVKQLARQNYQAY